MRYILIFIYIVVNIFLFVLNLELFTARLDVDLGFGIYTILPLLMLQIFGLLFLVVFAITDGMKDLKRELKLVGLQNKVLHLEKDLEIALLKDNKSVVVKAPKSKVVPETEA